MLAFEGPEDLSCVTIAALLLEAFLVLGRKGASSTKIVNVRAVIAVVAIVMSLCAVLLAMVVVVV